MSNKKLLWLRCILKGILERNKELVYRGFKYINLNIHRKRTWIKNVQDYKMRLYTRKSHAINLYLDDYYEKAVTDYLKERLTNNTLFIDIGANIGYYTTIMAKLCKNIIAFEPVDENYRIILDNLKMNQIQNVTVEKKAISFNKYDKIFLSDIGHGMHSITEKSTNDYQTIETVGLEDYFFSKNIDIYTTDIVIKSDTEGHELEVLKSIPTLIQAKLCEIIFEFSNHSPKKYKKELIDQFEDKFIFYILQQSSKDPVDFEDLLKYFEYPNAPPNVNILAKPKQK